MVVAFVIAGKDTNKSKANYLWITSNKVRFLYIKEGREAACKATGTAVTGPKSRRLTITNLYNGSRHFDY